jgi:PadR family transcriptional regulator
MMRFALLTDYKRALYSYSWSIKERKERNPVGKDKSDLLPGTLDLLVLKTVEAMGPIHGWGIAKRIEQVSQDLLEMKYGTLYPALMKLEQNGWISSAWGASENNRRARFYSITKQGRKQLALEAKNWEQMAAFIARVLGNAR